MKQKHILILGAGVAGLATAQELARKAPENLRITLVDQSDVHVLKADLYEVATAFNPEITEECLVRLKSTVATPILSLVDPERVGFVQDSVKSIDPKKKIVHLEKSGKLSYDTLVVALGSSTNFFKVPGIERSALPLKTVQDALKINCRLDHLFFELYKNKKNKSVHITIGGGGATGVEMASELNRSLTKLCKKYHYPRSKVHVQLIQSGKDLGSLNEKGTQLVADRLVKLGVCLYMGYRVQKVTPDKVVVSDPKGKLKTLASDLLIWTAGVQVNRVVSESLGEQKLGGAVPVHATLQSKKYPNIFAAGDNAYLGDSRHPGVRLPMLAFIAKSEGLLVAKNILRACESKTLSPFREPGEWMLLPLGGKFGLMRFGPIFITGFFAWFFRRLVILRYHLSVLPFFRALRKWEAGEKIFKGND